VFEVTNNQYLYSFLFAKFFQGWVGALDVAQCAPNGGPLDRPCLWPAGPLSRECGCWVAPHTSHCGGCCRGPPHWQAISHAATSSLASPCGSCA